MESSQNALSVDAERWPTTFTAADERVPLYDPAVIADLNLLYARMRVDYPGGLVPVDIAEGVPATLVISHRTAVRILHDTDPAHFTRDPRIWQETIDATCPVLSIMGDLQAARFRDGEEHWRLRTASEQCLSRLDSHQLHHDVRELAIARINTFCGDGTADLVKQYAYPLVVDVVNQMIGCPADIGGQVARGMAARFDGRHTEALQLLREALMELIRLKRDEVARPGLRSRTMDIASGLVTWQPKPRNDRTAPQPLTDEEVFGQLMSLYGAGIEPLTHLIVNTILLMLTDPVFGGGVLGGNLSVDVAVKETMFRMPPLIHFAITYPKMPMLIGDTWLLPHQPVLIGIAACNTDSAVWQDGPEGLAGRIANSSHLSYGAGPHICPANAMSDIAAGVAIAELVDALPDMTLAVTADELIRRPGLFMLSFEAMPVEFPSSPPISHSSGW